MIITNGVEHHNKEITKCHDAMSPISEPPPPIFFIVLITGLQLTTNYRNIKEKGMYSMIPCHAMNPDCGKFQGKNDSFLNKSAEA